MAALALARSPRTVLIEAADDKCLLVLVQEVAQALGLGTDPALIGQVIAKRLPKWRPEATYAEGAALLRPAHGGQTAPADAARMAQQALGPLLGWARGQTHMAAVWPQGLFLSGDAPNTPAPEITSIVGPARNLIYGPYLHLPPASYRAEIVLAFSSGIEDIHFSIEVLARSCRARAMIEPRPAGAYRGGFSFGHVNPADPVEIRLRNEKGSIEGEIALVEVRLWPNLAIGANELAS